MRVEQRFWTEEEGWHRSVLPTGMDPFLPQLVLLFGGTAVLMRRELQAEARRLWPEALVVGCSTAGEICGLRVHDDSLVVTAIQFESSRIEASQLGITAENSRRTGEELARSLDEEGLVHVFVLSEGLNINGSELVEGLLSALPKGVTVTGGLSGDGAEMSQTLVSWDESVARDRVAAIGFYGDRLRVGYGSLGGWDPFGPERVVTRAEGNVLYELDGKSALELYKDYLGDHSEGLPSTALLFPLSVRTGDGEVGVVRTILGIDEENESMIFAGEIPEGAYARLMKANFDRLLDGAAGAAQTSYEAIGSRTPDLAILISCVGRKMVLKQRVEEEVEAVQEVLGDGVVLTGFYSYGEISPFTPGARCELHNQTMTITTLSEV